MKWGGCRRSRLQCDVIICFVFVIIQHHDSGKELLQAWTRVKRPWTRTVPSLQHSGPQQSLVLLPLASMLLPPLTKLCISHCIYCMTLARRLKRCGVLYDQGWWAECKNVGVGWRMTDGALKVNADFVFFSQQSSSSSFQKRCGVQTHKNDSGGDLFK